MPVTKSNVEEVFTYHPADEEQRKAYEAIREKAKEMAYLALDVVPQSADQQAGLRLLREAVMTFNAAIATRGAV